VATIQEAIKRGYRTGTRVFYGSHTTGNFYLDCDTLGSGEFAVVDGDVIKYESSENTGYWRRYDTIYSAKEKEWVRIVKQGETE